VTTEGLCRDVQQRLTEAFLARSAPGAGDRAHAEACPACRALGNDLRALAEGLDASGVPELAAGRAAAVRRRAAAELAWAAVPLPAVLLIDTALFRVGGTLLAEWLPAALVTAIGVAFALGTASWMALIYGSLPFVAQRSAARRNARRTAAATPLDSR
jgi:hypothetical protein